MSTVLLFLSLIIGMNVFFGVASLAENKFARASISLAIAAALLPMSIAYAIAFANQIK